MIIHNSMPVEKIQFFYYMFEHINILDLPSVNVHEEEGERLSSGLPAKSSVKVSMPIEDQEQFVSDNERTVVAGSQNSQNSISVLGKFANYIKFHAVEPYDIWEHKKTLQYLVFIDVVQKKIGYKFNTQEILSLKAISTDDNLSLANFNSLGIWTQKSNLKTNILSVISQRSLFDIKKRNSSLKNLHKFDTRKSEDQSFNETKIFKKTQGDKSRMRTTCDQLTKTFLKSGFVSDECKHNKIEALRQDLEMNALQKKWELVVMAGQMNKWINDSLSDKDHQNNRIPVMFKIVSNSQNFKIVKVDENKHQEVIPEVVFYKKYHALKKKQQGNKQIESKVVNQVVLGIAGLGTNKNQTNKPNQRDKELNQALLHIMRVKNILQYQHKILSETAINT